MTEKKSAFEIAEARIRARKEAEAEEDAKSLEEACCEAERLAQRDKELRSFLSDDNALEVLRDICCLDEKFENSFLKRMQRPEPEQLSLPAFLFDVLEEYDVQTNRSTLVTLVQKVSDLFVSYDLGAGWVEELEAKLAKSARHADAAIDRLNDDKGSDIRHDHINPSKTIEIPTHE